ncbi:MAG: hypothetical protein JO091_06155 [Acidobacteriaceae bacterium]|nr:hypothetical protein [Acidobacteriaceae bacterium]
MTPTTPETEYAFWTEPVSAFTITYSLGLFHEIDFQVNEGYRRIPHGGIEIGGLLFGRGDKQTAKIEAFRVIECEHASGPSFVLSDRDVAGLEKQIAAAKSDPELEGMDVLGWFIAHTRTPLRMSDREARLFDDFFGGPGKIMLLIKPERFQPTRFGFLVRGADGQVARDATQQAIILPLPGRATRSDEGPVASIPAPAERTTRSAPVASQPQAPTSRAKEPEPQPTASAPVKQKAEREVSTTPPEREPPAVIDSGRSPKTAKPAEAPPIRTREPEEVMSLIPFDSGNALPSVDEIRRRRWEYLQSMGYDPRMEQLLLTGQAAPQSLRSNLRLALVLFFSAMLGCGVGYWGYSQLPSATIPLNVQPQPSQLLVSWPPEQTRDAVFAAIRINDGEEVPLSPLQRAAGQAKVTPPTDNMKIEVIAQHWMRDSRGIIRYVRPLAALEAEPPQTLKPAGRRSAAAAAEDER